MAVVKTSIKLEANSFLSQTEICTEQVESFRTHKLPQRPRIPRVFAYNTTLTGEQRTFPMVSTQKAKSICIAN